MKRTDLSQSTIQHITEIYEKTGKRHFAIDLASHVVQICYYSFAHKKLINKEIRTTELEKVLSAFAPGSLIIGFEVCGACHYWARRALELGHDYRCFPNKYVAIHKGNEKTDKIDAFAIFKATIDRESKDHSIACKSLPHQLLSNLMSTRASIVKQKIISINGLRSFLYEQGISLPRDISHRKIIKHVDEHYAKLCQSYDIKSDICQLFLESSQAFIDNIQNCVEIIERLDKKIELLARTNETCQLLRTIPGVGYVISMMLYIAGYNIENFKNAKHFAGFCGIAPHVEGSGGSASTISIRHYGNRELAGLLYTGSMAHYSQKIKPVLETSDDPKIQELKQKRRKVLICAIANHVARCAFAIMRDKKPYVDSKSSGFLTAFNKSL